MDMRRRFVRSLALTGAMALAVGTASVGVASDLHDLRKSSEAERASGSDSIEERVRAARGRLEDWYAAPETIPEDVSVRYRRVVRLVSFKIWEETSSAQEIIGAIPSRGGQADPADYFFSEVYVHELNEPQETHLSLRLYRFDYETSIRPGLERGAARSDRSYEVLRRALLGTIGSGFPRENGSDQPGNENGEITLIRLTTGISLTNIMQHGLRGGPNGELARIRKAWTEGLDSLSIAKGSFLRQVDVVDTREPKRFQVTIDERSFGDVFGDPAPRIPSPAAAIFRHLPNLQRLSLPPSAPPIQ